MLHCSESQSLFVIHFDAARLVQAALDLWSLPKGRKNAMELVPIAEAQPSLAVSTAKLRIVLAQASGKAERRIPPNIWDSLHDYVTDGTKKIREETMFLPECLESYLFTPASLIAVNLMRGLFLQNEQINSSSVNFLIYTPKEQSPSQRYKNFP